jgi:hypothetical protein
VAQAKRKILDIPTKEINMPPFEPIDPNAWAEPFSMALKKSREFDRAKCCLERN